ncbi:MAG: ATP-dependent helicase RecQ [Planctomycetota bacterium]
MVRSISSLHAQYDFESTSPSFSPPSAKSHAFQLLQRGASIDDVVAATERTKSTVIGYLCEFIEQEKITDPGKWLSVDPNVSRRVRAAVGVVGSDKLKPIYEALNEEVSYDTIRVVLACLQRK